MNPLPKNTFVDPLLDIFESVEHYKALWASLLINESKAQLLSEVVSSQSSPSVSWILGGKVAVGTFARLELTHTARDHSSSCEDPNSLDLLVVIHVTSTQVAGIGSPVCTNNLLLFVRQQLTIEWAMQGKAFKALDEGLGNQELRKAALVLLVTHSTIALVHLMVCWYKFQKNTGVNLSQ
jgi:hypothetical protein